MTAVPPNGNQQKTEQTETYAISFKKPDPLLEVVVKG